MWHVLLFLLGLILLAVEVFVTPGMGFLGIGGILCMFVGLVLIAVPTSGQGPFPMPAREMADYLRQSVLWAVLAIVTSGGGFLLSHPLLRNVPILNRLILADHDTDDPVPVGNPTGHVSGDEAIGSGKVIVGMTGTTVTPLRPGGEIAIDGRTIDVVSLGDWIDAGQPVRVVEVHGNRIVVDANPTA